MHGNTNGDSAPTGYLTAYAPYRYRFAYPDQDARQPGSAGKRVGLLDRLQQAWRLRRRPAADAAARPALGAR